MSIRDFFQKHSKILQTFEHYYVLIIFKHIIMILYACMQA